jgi:single-strand DNA-binding protein
MDKVILIGHLGKDAELRFTPTGRQICQFSVATTRKWRDADGNKKEHTNWYRCGLWGKRGEGLAQYLVKGTRVCVEGHLSGDEHGGPRVWQAEDGSHRAGFEVMVEQIELLGSPRTGAGPVATDVDSGDNFSDEDFIDF